MARTIDPRDARLAARIGLVVGLVGLVGLVGKPVPAQVRDQGKGPGPASPPTYAKDIAPIFQQKCQNCHRQGQSGPFPLETYEHARRRASDISTVVEGRSMPPWMPAPGVGPPLKHTLGLTAGEVRTILAWAEADAPEGDPADLPPPRTFAEGWALGTPDLILEPAEEFRIPASGPDIYRCFVLPTNLARDTYISAVEYRPANRRAVHHMTAFIDVSGMARKRDQADTRGPGYTSFTGPGIPFFDVLGFWATGHEPVRLPEGVGLNLPRQSDVILQIHYTPTGKPEVDRTRLGIYFHRGPVRQAMHWCGAQNESFQLPAGESEIEIRASWYVPVDLEALAISPHMHLLGRDIRMSVTYPNGRSEDLISIPRWDPAWQSMYQFEELVPLPAGSVVQAVAHFDNSDHPRNPHHPPKLVRWGHGAEDEMLDGFLAVVKKGQDLTQPRARDDLGEIFAKQRLKNFRKEASKGRR